MYVATIPNRNSPPTILLRESYRQDGKVKTRTLANITHLGARQMEALRLALTGSPAVPSATLPDCFRIVRSLPHGHVAAVLGCLRNLQLDSLLDPSPGRRRDLVIAMIVARIIEPGSELATARGLHTDTLHHSLAESLHLDSAGEAELYQALDWLLPRQSRIEQALAKRQLSRGGLVLYDLTSTYFEGRHCPPGKLGHSRDDTSGKLPIVFGLLTNAAGCPVAVEVFAGNTSGPNTVATQVGKLRQRFGLSEVALIGDRGMITSARIREDLLASQGIQWISALRASQIRRLAAGGQLPMSLFDKTDLVEIAHPDFPGQRLIACFHPLLAGERARKRLGLLAATEKQLEKIAVATKRRKRPLRGKQNIALRAGRILNRYKTGKHFQLRIEEDSFAYERKTADIAREQTLDGIYVIRTTVNKEALSSQQVVASYNSLAGAERAFRSLKTVDLQARPIPHRLPDRVRAHILLRMLAYYVEWHMRQLLAPILFDDHAKPQALPKHTAGGSKLHSFQTLLGDLTTIVRNTIQPTDKNLPAFDMLTQPTPVQQRALDLLGVTLRAD